MKMVKVTLENFRSYSSKVEVDISNLNAFIGKNDIGKSTILEALDIFFNENNGTVKLDKDDFNKQNSSTDIIISVVFENFDDNIIIDTITTSLKNEYLLNINKQLEIIRRISKSPSDKVTHNIFIKANHPTNKTCKDLLLKKNEDLKKIIKDLQITCENQTINSKMRQSIWNFCENSPTSPTGLELAEIEIDLKKEDAKNIWDKLKNQLPCYALFQSDRKNSDQDDEVKDPIKFAIQHLLKDDTLINQLNEVANKVNEQIKSVLENTLEKLKEMNPDVAGTLNPNIPNANELKWADVFKQISITSDDDIPINKRGSGIKRLILLNFFRAEAERKAKENNIKNVIYAIEEPETSQHPDHQVKLIEALKELSKNSQILLTTHSPAIVKLLEFENLKLIKKNESGNKEIVSVDKQELPYPSLNEVNFLAFNTTSEEYHNELYGYIEAQEKFNCFKKGKATRPYIKLYKGKTINETNILSQYIRDQIHHPENTLNDRYLEEELLESIKLMREFIQNNIK